MAKRLHYGTAVTFLSSLRPNRWRVWKTNIRSLYNSARRHRIGIRASKVGGGFRVWRVRREDLRNHA